MTTSQFRGEKKRKSFNDERLHELVVTNVTFSNWENVVQQQQQNAAEENV
jgi:hypothetical protein